jgi:hypothetical protein
MASNHLTPPFKCLVNGEHYANITTVYNRFAGRQDEFYDFMRIRPAPMRFASKSANRFSVLE